MKGSDKIVYIGTILIIIILQPPAHGKATGVVHTYALRDPFPSKNIQQRRDYDETGIGDRIARREPRGLLKRGNICTVR